MISDKDRAAYQALGILSALYRAGCVPESLREFVTEVLARGGGVAEKTAIAAIKKAAA